jgi:hypothetical protein
VAAENANRWDLFSYNADYFSRLNQMIAKAAQVGVVVQLVLFDRCGLDYTGSGGNEVWKDAAGTPYTIRRWDDSPWNKFTNAQDFLQGSLKTLPDGRRVLSGLPDFFLPNEQLRAAQKAYIQQVVSQTKNNWNVFYEVMNEPNGGTLEDRVYWADWVVGVINGLTGGSSLVFYNDFHGGADVNRWKALGLANYNNFHGVIFHGVPTAIDPEAADASTRYKFVSEKIFQVSTDGVDKNIRGDKGANYDWCHYAFLKKMIFQAHTFSTDAALGIGLNHPMHLV